jgi:hypothetical protein
MSGHGLSQHDICSLTKPAIENELDFRNDFFLSTARAFVTDFSLPVRF